ncbi:MAG: hypothetical protein AVDCRST_MAG01-01-340, partial [uncultured Rubrobacteraceae bacterium]
VLFRRRRGRHGLFHLPAGHQVAGSPRLHDRRVHRGPGLSSSTRSGPSTIPSTISSQI